jgi:hypothetical protein
MHLKDDEKFIDIEKNVDSCTIYASKVIKASSISFELLPETIGRFKDQINKFFK